MEEVLKQILTRLENIDEKVGMLDEKFEMLDEKFEMLDTKVANIDTKVDIVNNRIDLHDKSNKEDFKQINKKLITITEAVAKAMEDITELKDKVENQNVEIRVMKGGK